MLYRKNIYTWEQLLRILAGVGVAAYVLYSWPASMMIYVIAAMAIGFAATGVIGWCPMCAMAGRKLDQQ